MQLESEGWSARCVNYERDEDCYQRLYEAKMVHQFTHRYGDYTDKEPDDEGTALPRIPASTLANPGYAVRSRYWVPKASVDDRLRSRWEHGGYWDGETSAAAPMNVL